MNARLFIGKTSMIETNHEDWNCPQCQQELGEYNAYCTYCYEENHYKVYNPSQSFIREECIESLEDEITDRIRKGER